MTDSAVNRSRLLALIDELAVVRGRVTLASGMEADYYLDLRRVTLEHRAAPLVGDVVLDLLHENGMLEGPDAVQAVGGLTMGADPVGTAVMHRSRSPRHAAGHLRRQEGREAVRDGSAGGRSRRRRKTCHRHRGHVHDGPFGGGDKTI